MGFSRISFWKMDNDCDTRTNTIIYITFTNNTCQYTVYTHYFLNPHNNTRQPSPKSCVEVEDNHIL